jgi:hypothetical protein
MRGPLLFFVDHASLVVRRLLHFSLNFSQVDKFGYLGAKECVLSFFSLVCDQVLNRVHV